ncbi:tautomerase family protein [Conexibacter sp. CPCC 206217]|uniref:tautomerase family protein n=1 Tax=Conexibacter sp. CPCC 206217 TaxID=3064574 RepID=UPI0027286E74|nr:tautomerase family protein [Conexibacter sp. CPCC 206217]MDO8208864.1 tautomerase family protein [Conexibacter sp. CPCC 206217]
MPVYQFGAIGVPLDEDQRDRLAEGITRIHSEETNAPEPFIRVVFLPIPEGFGYTAGGVAPSVIVNGGIRAGRSDATRHAIMRRIHELVLDVVGVPAGQIVVSTMDLPSQWLMEAGLVMPQPIPEEEAAWFARLEDAGSIAESRVA